MADCNYLKRTNDTLGHEYGDLHAAADGTEVNKTYIIDIRKYHFCIGNP